MAYIVTDYMPLKMPVPGSREPAQIALLNENSQLIAGHDHSAGEGLPVSVLRSGLAGNRPAVGEAGAFWFATDNGLASLDTGAAWVDFITSAAQGQVLRDPVVRDAVRFGPEGSGVIDVTIQRTGAGALTLEGTPLLNQALGDARYLRIGGQQLVNSVNGRTGAVVLTAVDVGALSQSAGDGRYVNVTGDSISGDLAIKSKYVAVSAVADNILTWNADGFYVPDPGIIPDVSIVSNNSLGVTEAPANTFMVVVNLSADAGNVLSLRGDGLHAQGVTGLSQATADLRYLQLTGGQLSGPLIVGGADITAYHSTSGVALHLQARSGFRKSIQFEDYAGAPRWFISSTEHAEVGSDAGSNFDIYRYSDSGVYLGTALSISRATGAATFGGALAVSGPLTIPLGHQVSAARFLVNTAGGGSSNYMIDQATGHFGIGIENVDYFLEIDSAGNLISKHKPVAVSPTAGNTLTWDATGFYVPTPSGGSGGGITQADADLRYVNVTGDTMTGQLAITNTGAVGLLVNNTGTWCAQINGSLLINLPAAGGSSIWAQVNSVKVFEVTQAGTVVITPVLPAYALDVTGDTAIKGGCAIHFYNPANTISAGWQYDNALGGVRYIHNGSPTGTALINGGGLRVTGTVDIAPGSESLAGTWFMDSTGARRAFVGTDGAAANTWRVYTNIAPQGDKLTVNLSTGAVTIPNALTVSGALTVTGTITGNGGVCAIASPNNIQLGPAGSYVHPDGHLTRYMGHPGLSWAVTYTGQVISPGQLNLTSGTNTPVIVAAPGGNFIYIRSSYHTFFDGTSGSGIVAPEIDNKLICGGTSNRWQYVAAVQGGINTCRAEEKDLLGLVDPADALDAVLHTPIHLFHPKDYLGNVDPDVTFAGQVDTDCDPRMQVSKGSWTSPNHQAGFTMASIQALHAMIDALRGEVARLKESLPA
jgi:hypothetical protein